MRRPDPKRRLPGEVGAAKTLSAATTTLILIAAACVVAASPYALRLFGGEGGDWERLSFIGQTYGAISALIAMLALVGVVMTLVYQARETHRAAEETRRQAMSDLLAMAMDDPELDECWGPVPADDDPKTRKQQLYTNMIVSQWAAAYEIRVLPEKRLRAVSNEMFRGPVGRAYWVQAREAQLSTAGTRRERRFAEILDEEYRTSSLAPDSRPASAAGGRHLRPTTEAGVRPKGSRVAAFVAGAVAGAAVAAGVWSRGFALGCTAPVRRRRRRSR